MGRGIQGLEEAYNIFFTGVLIVLAVLIVLCLIRAIIGPKIADRIVSVNMMGTMVIVTIAILALMLGEGYLVDICIIYAMISFLAVIVLTKVYMGVYLERREKENKNKNTGKIVQEGMAEEKVAEDLGTKDQKIEDKRIEDKKIEDKRIEDKRIEDKRIEDKRIEDKRIEDKRIEDKRIEDINKEDIRIEDINKEDIKKEGIKIEDIKTEDIKTEDKITGDAITQEIMGQENSTTAKSGEEALQNGSI